MPSADKRYTPKKPRNQELAYIEADILTNIRIAAEFARLAEAHASLFDDGGFNYCLERFLEHARAVAYNQKKLKGSHEAALGQ
jgi:hypothetical protein